MPTSLPRHLKRILKNVPTHCNFADNTLVAVMTDNPVVPLNHEGARVNKTILHRLKVSSHKAQYPTEVSWCHGECIFF